MELLVACMFLHGEVAALGSQVVSGVGSLEGDLHLLADPVVGGGVHQHLPEVGGVVRQGVTSGRGHQLDLH